MFSESIIDGAAIRGDERCRFTHCEDPTIAHGDRSRRGDRWIEGMDRAGSENGRRLGHAQHLTVPATFRFDGSSPRDSEE
jgi:hypothetical protein